MRIINPSESSAHWYYADGRPCYELPKKDGKGMKVPTLADARKLNLVPSVTTILKVLDKPQLNRWLQEQAVLACLTATRQPGEDLDAFVNRVLNIEKQQDQEASIARDIGIEIHDAIEGALRGKPVRDGLRIFVDPVVEAVMKLGRPIAFERIVVGNGFAGRMDTVVEGEALIVIDYKTTRKVPKASYPEHRMQLSAYATALENMGGLPVRTANIYISKETPGEISVDVHDDWEQTFAMGFMPVLQFWQWNTGYTPQPEIRKLSRFCIRP